MSFVTFYFCIFFIEIDQHLVMNQHFRVVFISSFKFIFQSFFFFLHQNDAKIEENLAKSKKGAAQHPFTG